MGFWKTMPTRRRSSITSSAGSMMSWPSKSDAPVVRTSSIRSFIRFRQRRNVDLPQPDGPISAVTSCRGKSMVMSNRACDLP